MGESPDFIPDNQFVPDQASPGSAPSAPAPGSASSSPDFIPDESFVSDSDKYSTPGQQVLTGAEGLARGVLGPLAPAAELGLSKMGVPGLSAEEQTGREKENPVIHASSEIGGLAGSIFTGVGEAALIGKAAGAIPFMARASEAGKAAKLGAAVIKNGVEAGLFQTGDELSKAMLGQGDPETPVASALSHVGFATLLGGGAGLLFSGVGKGLKAIASSKAGTKVAQFLEDFGNRWRFNQQNPDLAEAVTNELHDFHTSTDDAAAEVYGATGLKAQAIASLVPPMNDAIAAQNQNIASRLQSKIREMMSDQDRYPVRLTKVLNDLTDGWMDVATNPSATSNDVFNATQDLKQKLQAYSKFDKEIGPLSPEKNFVNATKELQSGLVTALEDENVWGNAGRLQKGVNKAFSSFLPALKDFRSKFTTKVQGEAVVDPGKINTYVRQLGKPNAEIKQGMLGSYIDAAEKYRNQISELHNGLGLENPITPSSLNATKGTLGKDVSAGAEFADKMFHAAIPSFASKVAGASVGAELGYHENGVKGAVIGGVGGLFAPKIANIIGRQLTHSGVPVALRLLGDGKTTGLIEAADYAAKVDRGAKKISGAVDSLFDSGKFKAIETMFNDRDRERVIDYLKNGSLDKEIQMMNQPEPQDQQQPRPAQGFAEGGDVSQINPSVMDSAQPSKNPIADHLPEQNMMLMSAMSRVSNYLNTIRPQEPQSLPFDKPAPNKQAERKFGQVVDMANQPLSILNKIKDGSLTSEDKGHFQSMYPEIYNHLSKKISERMVQAQTKGERPPYKTRQALSLFLGAPLDSSMTPQNMMAAQQVFVGKKAAQANQVPQKSRGHGSTLNKVAQSHQTEDEARIQRQQKS